MGLVEIILIVLVLGWFFGGVALPTAGWLLNVFLVVALLYLITHLPPPRV